VAVGLSGSQSGVDYQLQIGGANTGSPVAGTGSAISLAIRLQQEIILYHYEHNNLLYEHNDRKHNGYNTYFATYNSYLS